MYGGCHENPCLYFKALALSTIGGQCKDMEFGKHPLGSGMQVDHLIAALLALFVANAQCKGRSYVYMQLMQIACLGFVLNPPTL